jgi:hypothetical protein
MPAAIKRRKISATKTAPASTRRIDTFTKVSKASSSVKTIIEKNDSVDVAITGTEAYAVTDRKRKLVESEEESSPPQSSDNSTRSIKSLPPRRTATISTIPKTPQHVKPTISSPILADTPTKGARTLLDRFCIAQTPTKSPLGFRSSSPGIIASTPKNPYAPIAEPQRELPVELVELINLHAAFLTALSIHYAHNGTHSPADLRNLCPDVARAWGKRKVTLEDIRRTLGVLNSQIDEENSDNRVSRLSLSDYGLGKICIEIRESTGKAGRIARPVNEDLLNQIFGRGLLDAWDQKTEETKLEEFIDSLPMEPISTCPSLLKISPMLAKGQRRLEDMKAVITVKKENSAAAKAKLSASVTKSNGLTNNSPRPTLLERLRAKALENKNAPPPPSSAELARRQALQRIEEVVSVLSILSTSSSLGQQRVSFTMSTVLGKLKDSFKTPMSKQEAETCVRLLASEIVPEWVKIVKMGKRDALVVDREGRVGEDEIRERVRRAS